jgi:NAD(P)-dependent dehydrogenase (short-subunit alcohol dehydrogenase family)
MKPATSLTGPMRASTRRDLGVSSAKVRASSSPTAWNSSPDRCSTSAKLSFDRLYSINVKGAFLTLQRAARHVADNRRIIYVGSSSTAFPQPGATVPAGEWNSPIAARDDPRGHR